MDMHWSLQLILICICTWIVVGGMRTLADIPDLNSAIVEFTNGAIDADEALWFTDIYKRVSASMRNTSIRETLAN